MFASEPLADSEDKIIERLGDCDVPVDYMDLLSHRIRCRKIEIFHYDDKVSFTPNDEEEEGEISCITMLSEDHTDDEDRTLQLVKDLDCLIRRIEQMQLVIKERKKQQNLESGVTEASTEQLKKQEELEALKKQPENQETPENAADKLSFEEQLEVRDLQHGHHRLQCKINEMISNYRVLRDLLEKLRGQLCQENRRCRKLSERIVQFQAWSQEVAKELPVCKERYHRLIQKKLTKSEAARVIKANIAKAYRRSKSYLSKRQLQFDLHEFHAEVDELMQYADDLRLEMIRRFTSFENDTPLPHSLIDNPSSAGASLDRIPAVPMDNTSVHTQHSHASIT